MVVSSCSAFRPRAWPAVDVQFAAGFVNYALSEAARNLLCASDSRGLVVDREMYHVVRLACMGPVYLTALRGSD
ncbi:MAG: hypothetical protein ACI8P0_001738 [Planctomycetaceae bacterium]|jgi:hypothetical protein